MVYGLGCQGLRVLVFQGAGLRVEGLGFRV
jgi:hypothetical protein